MAPLPSDVDGRAPWETAEHAQATEYGGAEDPPPQPEEYASMEEIPICQVEELAPVPDLFPALLPAKEAPRTARTSTRSSACRPPTCSTSLRRATLTTSRN